MIDDLASIDVDNVNKDQTNTEQDHIDLFENLFLLTKLSRTWRKLRTELRQADTRDVIDWTDWALTIETSLPVIRNEVLSGDYVPSRATRIESGKSKGSYRIVSVLNVRDALIYRHICDHADISPKSWS